MARYIDADKVYEMLNALGGCGAEPESWADGWDKAIDAAINGLSAIPTEKRPFAIKRCAHKFETLKEIFPDSWGLGGKLILCCTKCGKIKKVRI